MNPTFLSLADLKVLFVGLISGFLGVAADSGTVRSSWQTYGAPGFAPTDDLCFLRVTYESNAINKMVETYYTPDSATTVTANQSYITTVRVNCIFYGPKSFDWADLVRASFFLESTNDTLKANNLGLVTDVPLPVHAPENFNAQWFDRSDFMIRFNQLVIRPETVPTIASAPVTVLTPKGGA